jgi:hypothetical protein
MSEPWFDPTLFGILVGAIGGGVGGSLFGCLGALAGMLIPRGRGRPFILGSLMVFLLLGVALLGFGVVALVAGQPFGIWFFALLVGVLFTVLGGVFIWLTRKLYTLIEQRRLDSEGLRNS